MNKNYLGRKYSIQEYDPAWSNHFKMESEAIENALENAFISIDHIGSTSVPGLAGKPTIDILVVINNIDDADGFVDALKHLGYKYLGQYVMDGSRLYVKEDNGERIVNLHFFQSGHKHISEMVQLRNYMRLHQDVVKEYSGLKFDLVDKYPDDYSSYRIHKDMWMDNLLKKTGIKS